MPDNCTHSSPWLSFISFSPRTRAVPLGRTSAMVTVRSALIELACDASPAPLNDALAPALRSAGSMGTKAGRSRLALPPRDGAAPAHATPATPEAATPLDGEIDDGDFGGLPALGGGGDFGGMGMVDFDAPAEEDPVERLRNLIEARKTETVEILRSWLEEDKEDVT